jgi:hypothetical protein
MQYFQVLISSEQRVQALNILDHLIAKRLVFGGPVLNGPAKFLWKGEWVQHDYCFISTVTREDLKDDLIREAEKASVEEVCMISFIAFEGNPALIKLLDDNFADRETKPPPQLRDAMIALTFVPTDEIGSRTRDSFGDLSQPMSDDGTR